MGDEGTSPLFNRPLRIKDVVPVVWEVPRPVSTPIYRGEGKDVRGSRVVCRGGGGVEAFLVAYCHSQNYCWGVWWGRGCVR